MCVLAPICGSQRLYRPRKIRALAQDSRMTVALRPVSGLRTPLRWLCLNCCESGNVTTAQLEFLGYTIPNQAFSERPVSILVMPTLFVFPQFRSRHHRICLPSLAYLALGLMPVQ